MLVPYWTVDIPYKSVIADLVSRDGPPGPDNYPFYGLQKHLEEVGRNSNKAIWLEALCNTSEDFNIRNLNFCIKYHNGRPFRCIDEVPAYALTAFMEQKLWGTVHYTGGAIAKNYYASQEQRSMATGEDEHLEYESSLTSETNSFSPEELNSWKRKLPYIVKRLVDHSSVFGINIISGVIAKAKCAADGVKVTLSGILDRGLLSYPDNAPVDRSYVPPAFIEWLMGEAPDEYYDDMSDLVNICDRLNIRLSAEDSTLYTREFVSDLACSYIVDNIRLYRSVARALSPNELSPDLLSLISRMSLDDVTKLPELVSQEERKLSAVTPFEAITHVINLFRFHSNVYHEAIRDPYRVTSAKLMNLFFLYYRITHKTYGLRDCSFVNEFLMRGSSEYFLFDVSEFVDEPLSGTVALIHFTGTLVLVKLNALLNGFKYLPFEVFYSNLQNYYTMQNSHLRPMPFHWYSGL